MKKTYIHQYFFDNYLTSGRTYDNFIFTKCSIEFLNKAKKYLSQKQDDCNACIIELSRNDEISFEKTLDKCKSVYQQKILARDYICLLIMHKLIEKSSNTESLQDIKNHLEVLINGDFESAITLHANAPFPHEITDYIKENKHSEINFLLKDTENKIIQSAINNFISSRTPYSVKIFTNNERLPSYYDESGTLIENPHDYMLRDLDVFALENDLQELGK